MAFSSLSRSLLSKMSASISPMATPELSPSVLSGGVDEPETLADTQESGFSHLMNKELYPVRERIVDDNCPCDAEPFSQLNGESIEYMGLLQDDLLIAISNYRLFATQEDGFYSVPLGLIEATEVFGTKDKLLVLCRDTRTFRLSFSTPFKCKLWQERIAECLRRLIKEPKAAFAFVHRAYNKDEKMAKQDLLRRHVEVGGDLAEWEELGRGRVLTNGETNPLLSLAADALSWRKEVMTREYERMGMGSSAERHQPWRISQCNDKYKLCASYPKLLVVPSSISDDELSTAAKFRMSGRIPAVVWRHQSNGCIIARSSQPLVGVLGLWRSPEDEKLLLSLSQSCVPPPVKKASNGNHFQGNDSPPIRPGGVNPSTSTPSKMNRNEIDNGCWKDVTVGRFAESDDDKDGFIFSEDGSDDGSSLSVLPNLKVFDLRSYAAALGNRAKGGGCECTDYYPNCEVEFKCLPNIHTVRKSYLQLRAVLMSEDQANFLSSLEGTQWLHYLCQLLSVACEVVGVVNDHAHPILIHCSDGWDRTTQVVALAELMLDPYYRTIKGFKVLIEREWLGYGHKFGDRCGLTTDDGNQQSPIFLQWLDCVHQLTRQFPCDFEFNDNFLLKLGRHVYSCLYGTFLYNCMRERELWRVTEDTTSVWAQLHGGNSDLVNYLYSRDTCENGVLRPVPNIRNMLLWKEMYVTSPLIPYQTPPVSSTVDSPVLHPPLTGQSNSASSSPSPTHHAALDQAGFLATTSDSDTNCEVDSGTKSTAEESDHAQLDASQTSDVACLDDSNATITMEDRGQQDDRPNSAVEEVKGPNAEGKDQNAEDTAIEKVKLQEDQVSGEESGIEGSEEGSVADSTSVPVANRHLLVMEHHRKGLNETSGSRRELANVLSQHHPSSVVIEMKDLTLLENGRLHDKDKNHSSSISRIPHSSTSLVSGERATSTPANPNAKSHSEPILTKRTSVGSNCCGPSTSSNNSYKTSALLVEAMSENQPRDTEAKDGPILDPVSASSIENGITTSSRVALGVDGLPCSLDPLQKRVRDLELNHKREVEELRISLKEAQLQAAEALRLRALEQEQGRLEEGRGEGDRDGLRERECGEVFGMSLPSDDMPSPSSLHSWDCVDHEDEHGVRWIPDHAATHCQHCGATFWTARRKHHCRSCGGVFCGTCSDFYCPVPHEQLFVDVRVCEKCYYRLDGHLNRNGQTSTRALT